MKQQKFISSIERLPIGGLQARARVNRFLLAEVGSQFCAGDPDPDVVRKKWRIPILLITPGFVAGQVGEAIVSMATREIEGHTNIEEIHAVAAKLRKRHHAAIKAAFLQTRKG